MSRWAGRFDGDEIEWKRIFFKLIKNLYSFSSLDWSFIPGLVTFVVGDNEDETRIYDEIFQVYFC